MYTPPAVRIEVAQHHVPVDHRWTTANEIKFLEELGTHRPGSPEDVADVPIEERLRLLRSYRRSIMRRVNWGLINRTAVLLEVNRMIGELVEYAAA